MRLLRVFNEPGGREYLEAVGVDSELVDRLDAAAWLGLEPEARRFPDTATIAARKWLSDAGIDPDAIWRERLAHPSFPDDTTGSEQEGVPLESQSPPRPVWVAGFVVGDLE